MTAPFMNLRAISLTIAIKTAITLAMAAALAALMSARASAETIVVDDHVTVAASDLKRPRGGMTMKTVEAQFGAPEARQPAVGKPPITRWDYPDFTVFFEHEYVIHTVVKAGYRCWAADTGLVTARAARP